MNIGFKIDEFMKYQSLFIIINALMAYKLADHFAKKNKRKVYLTDIAVDVLPFTLLALNLSKVGFIIAFLILQLKIFIIKYILFFKILIFFKVLFL